MRSDLPNNDYKILEFDAVMVCNGHYHTRENNEIWIFWNCVDNSKLMKSTWDCNTKYTYSRLDMQNTWKITTNNIRRNSTEVTFRSSPIFRNLYLPFPHDVIENRRNSWLNEAFYYANHFSALKSIAEYKKNILKRKYMF